MPKSLSDRPNSRESKREEEERTRTVLRSAQPSSFSCVQPVPHIMAASRTEKGEKGKKKGKKARGVIITLSARFLFVYFSLLAARLQTANPREHPDKGGEKKREKKKGKKKEERRRACPSITCCHIRHPCARLEKYQKVTRKEKEKGEERKNRSKEAAYLSIIAKANFWPMSEK